jgi:hypothetical protein
LQKAAASAGGKPSFFIFLRKKLEILAQPIYPHEKVVLCILLILAAVLCTAGCTDDGGDPAGPVTGPTVPHPPAQPTVEGTWYSQDIIEYTDPSYQTTNWYDIELVFNKDTSGYEKWTSVDGLVKEPFGFTWMKNLDDSVTIFYTNGYPLSVQMFPSRMVTLSYDGQTLMDEDANTYTKILVRHTPPPTPEPTPVPKYYTDKVETIRGDWRSTTLVEGPGNTPCRLQYDFNLDGTGVEEWIATEYVGNQAPGTIETWNFTWSRSTSDSQYGAYIVTVTKNKGGIRTEVHAFSFASADFTSLIDENGLLYLKTK